MFNIFYVREVVDLKKVGLNFVLFVNYGVFIFFGVMGNVFDLGVNYNIF